MDDTILLFGACSLNMINLRVSSKIKLELIYLFIFFYSLFSEERMVPKENCFNYLLQG